MSSNPSQTICDASDARDVSETSVSPTTREPQYQRCVELSRQGATARLGLMSGQTWHDDPKRLTFVLARYKFVSRMLTGRERVLEVGCADAFGTRIVQQAVGHVTAVDFDPVFIEDARARMHPDWPLDCRVHDMLEGPVADGPQPYDAAYCLDVLEHIAPTDEDRFVANLAGSLGPHGVAIVGMPSIHSQAHASPASKAGHVNCKDEPALRTLMQRHFHQVFIFSMNDEVVHTGFTPMAHYLLALACDQRDTRGGVA